MKRAILIEDRVFRQKNYLGDNLNKLMNLDNLLNVSGGEGFTIIKERFLSDDYTLINDYDVLMIHRSAFDTEIRNKIISNIGDSNKDLILFSGGVSGCSFTSIKKAQLLVMNVDQFYGSNLFLYVQNGCANLLELAFGENWRLSVLLEAYDRLSFYIKGYSSPKPFTRIESDIEISDWVKNNYFKDLKGMVVLEDLKVVLQKMALNINDML
jgi:hypothetical protein